MNKFDHLIIIGRPAAGKSEFIDFMKEFSLNERVEKYHIANFEEMDDFTWLWKFFQEDSLWEDAGYERKYTKDFKGDGNYGLLPGNPELFDVMMAKFNKEIIKYKDNPDFYKDNTLFIEFARGGDTAYANAFSRLSKDVLNNAAILFLDVSFEESWRKNVARYEAKLKHSILAHMVPRETMDAYYQTNDWPKFTNNKDSGYIEIHGLKIPFVTMKNEPEITDPKLLDERYGSALSQLWELYNINQ